MEINSQIQQKSSPVRMSKQKTLALARNFKQWIVAGSIVIFGCISALVAINQSSIATQNSGTDPNSSNSAQQQNQQPSTSSYFNQRGDDNFGQRGSNTWNGGRPNGGSHSS